MRTLRDLGYSEDGCARRLGVDPLLGIQFHHAPAGRLGAMVRSAAGPAMPDWLLWTSSDDPCDQLIGLFVAGESVRVTRLERTLDSVCFDTLLETGLLVLDDDLVHSPFCLYPIQGQYVATDRPGLQPGINPVSALYPETYILASAVDRATHLSRVLDLGTGSGVHALLAAGHADHTLGVDISPRAVAFARFNRALNAQPAAEFVLGDLYEPCPDGARYDLIVSNPPYVPSAEHAAGSNWFSGGPSGDEILSRILGGLDDRLAEDGVALLYAMLVHHGDVPYRDKLDTWLGGLGRWDVTVRAVPFVYRSTEEIVPAPSRYELGMITVRRCPAGEDGRYSHTSGRLTRD